MRVWSCLLIPPWHATDSFTLSLDKKYLAASSNTTTSHEKVEEVLKENGNKLAYTSHVSARSLQKYTEKIPRLFGNIITIMKKSFTMDFLNKWGRQLYHHIDLAHFCIY